MVRNISIIVMALLCVCCDSFEMKGFIAPTSDVVNKRFEKSMSLSDNKAVKIIEADESYTFYVCTDPHIDGSYNNLREFSTRLRNDSHASFGVVLGDCQDGRNNLPKYIEAIEYIDDVQSKNLPIFSLIGNHDIYFNGWNEFTSLLGPSVYWFELKYAKGRDIFIVLDSASGTLGGKQMSWLREFLSSERDKYRHCFVLTHTNIFYTDNSQLASGCMNLEETALLSDLFNRHKVTLCLQGHDHYRDDIMLGGVRYTIVGTINDEALNAEYLIVQVSNSGIEYHWKYIK